MPIGDPLLDPIYRKMIAAFEGDTDAWLRITRGLRDAIVDHARSAFPTTER